MPSNHNNPRLWEDFKFIKTLNSGTYATTYVCIIHFSPFVYPMAYQPQEARLHNKEKKWAKVPRNTSIVLRGIYKSPETKQELTSHELMRGIQDKNLVSESTWVAISL